MKQRILFVMSFGMFLEEVNSPKKKKIQNFLTFVRFANLAVPVKAF